MKTRKKNINLDVSTIRKIERISEIAQIKKTEVYLFILEDFTSLMLKSADKNKREQFKKILSKEVEKMELNNLRNETKEVQISITKKVDDMLKKLLVKDLEKRTALIIEIYIKYKLSIAVVLSRGYAENENIILADKNAVIDILLTKQIKADLKYAAIITGISQANILKYAIEQYRTHSIPDIYFFKKRNIKTKVLIRLKKRDTFEIKLNDCEDFKVMYTCKALNREIVLNALQTLLYSDYYTNIFFSIFLKSKEFKIFEYNNNKYLTRSSLKIQTQGDW